MDAAFSAGTHIEYVKSGTLKMLAAATDDRHTYAPNASTLLEQGIPYALDPIYFFAVPKGLSIDAKNALIKAIADAMKDPEVIKFVETTFKVPVLNYGRDTKVQLEANLKSIKAMVAKNK